MTKPTVPCPHCGGTGKLALSKIHVGELILIHRSAKGLTQENLSKSVGLSRAQIANIESGRSDMPIKTLARIADALGCTMRDLVPG